MYANTLLAIVSSTLPLSLRVPPFSHSTACKRGARLLQKRAGHRLQPWSNACWQYHLFYVHVYEHMYSIRCHVQRLKVDWGYLPLSFSICNFTFWDNISHWTWLIGQEVLGILLSPHPTLKLKHVCAYILHTACTLCGCWQSELGSSGYRHSDWAILPNCWWNKKSTHSVVHTFNPSSPETDRF